MRLPSGEVGRQFTERHERKSNIRGTGLLLLVSIENNRARKPKEVDMEEWMFLPIGGGMQPVSLGSVEVWVDLIYQMAVIAALTSRVLAFQGSIDLGEI